MSKHAIARARWRKALGIPADAFVVLFFFDFASFADRKNPAAVLEAFERLDMSAEDKQKVAAWKALINDAGSVLTSNLCTTDLATSLGATPDNVTNASAFTPDLRAKYYTGGTVWASFVLTWVLRLRVVFRSPA